ncbi:MAG TPA: serine hydrolase domain-containing protein [Flavisolibacter sp.]|jgi:CubicO group peptidase (beta-lactamase class C family)|nr:serine hydrolase domain-containing protein [Flavisolibacter sp.]
MTKKMILILLLMAAGLSFTLIDNNRFDMRHIDNFLKHEVVEGKTPSVQYCFFDTDSVIYTFTDGYADVKNRRPVDAHTTYNLFSVTKTITALAVLQLAEEGKVDLKKPASVYLPNFPYPNNITVEQLLNHSSGIPNPMPLKWIHLETEHVAFQRDPFFRTVFQNNKALKSEPGTRFFYSNLGYVLLGQIIETVSGKSYEAYVTEKIIQKAGIDTSSLGFTIHPVLHAKGYQKAWSFMNLALDFLLDKRKYMDTKEGAWKPFKHFYSNGTSYGGMIGSRQGLVKYGQALLKSDSLLLRPSSRHLLFQENVIGGKPTGMSFSWYTGNVKNHSYVAHAGGGGGYYIELRLYPDLGVGSVILFNRSGMKDERLLDKADSFFLTEKQQAASM